jgi:hypothetical protein
MDDAFLAWALAPFSGYVAADELSEGPSCVLSAVDNRQYKRILSAVLDHDPTHDDITVFLGRLKTALEDRDLALKGITTDGSALDPEPLRSVFGDVRPSALHLPWPQGPAPRGLESGGHRARPLGQVQTQVGAWPTVVQRQRGPPFGAQKQIDATENQ